MSARPNIWLSIDWDYFVREHASWDLAHGEDALMRDMIWPVRTAMLAARGIDLRTETSLRHARPAPASFWGTLERLGYRFDTLKCFFAADSHRWAHSVFDHNVLGGPPPSDTRIVHFDAHHDLVYSIEQLQWSIGTGEPTCENWHLMTLLRSLGLRSLVVYPAWKGSSDWQKLFGALDRADKAGVNVARILRARVDHCVWPSPKVAEAAGNVEAVFVCRSGGWAPPWHDLAFRRFCLAARERFGRFIETPWIDIDCPRSHPDFTEAVASFTEALAHHPQAAEIR